MSHSQQSYLALNPVCFNTNLPGKMWPLAQQWWEGNGSNQSLSDWIWGLILGRESHVQYGKPTQKPMIGEVIALWGIGEYAENT